LLSTDNEINGLTLGGVGSGTTLNHIQVSFSNDDSFEFFGGTVNADHLIALARTDDDFDFDNGYSGTIQYALALKDPFSTHTVSGGVSDANGIESDNNAAGNGALTPLTNPKLRNFTILGYSTNSSASDLEKANHWRRLHHRLIFKIQYLAGLTQVFSLKVSQLLVLYSEQRGTGLYNCIYHYNY
jgi:hypothetical protein